jgi:hypothetical protein
MLRLPEGKQQRRDFGDLSIDDNPGALPALRQSAN